VKRTAALLAALSFASLAVAAPLAPTTPYAAVSFSALMERLATFHRHVVSLFEGAEKDNTGKG
jgi:hypothetical protein